MSFFVFCNSLFQSLFCLIWVLLQLSFDFHLYGIFFFPNPLTSSLYVFLDLYMFLSLSYFFVGALNSFVFKVIIDMYVSIIIFFLVLDLFL